MISKNRHRVQARAWGTPAAVAVLAALCANHAVAQSPSQDRSDELAQVREELQALLDRVSKVEAQNVELQAQNEELKSQGDYLKAETRGLRKSTGSLAP